MEQTNKFTLMRILTIVARAGEDKATLKHTYTFMFLRKRAKLGVRKEIEIFS